MSSKKPNIHPVASRPTSIIHSILTSKSSNLILDEKGDEQFHRFYVESRHAYEEPINPTMIDKKIWCFFGWCVSYPSGMLRTIVPETWPLRPFQKSSSKIIILRCGLPPCARVQTAYTALARGLGETSIRSVSFGCHDTTRSINLSTPEVYKLV